MIYNYHYRAYLDMINDIHLIEESPLIKYLEALTQSLRVKYSLAIISIIKLITNFCFNFSNTG